MWKVLSLLVLALSLSLVPSAHAAADPCTKYGVCVVVWNDANGVCAGVGFGLQGVGACADAVRGCATVIYGFHRDTVCTTFALS